MNLKFLIASALYLPVCFAQSLSSSFYEIGTPSVTDYYVDAAAGDDSNSGTSRSTPRKTVSSIWNQIPQNTPLTNGYRINLLPGAYTSDHLPNYWENRFGTAAAPIILQAADGYGTVFFSRDINMAGVKYFYALGLDIKNEFSAGNYGDAFHCERCDHILLRGNSLNGAPLGRATGRDVAQETIKFNQSQYVYIENNNIQGASDNGIDWVNVQYGHILANRIHDTQSWCAYVKGGSSYILIEANLVFDCGEGGITAGQGTGFEFMSAPWLQFEANYIKIVNNILYNIDGAALGVNGGYNILFAYNTAYNIGRRSHVFEAVFGERSCDGTLATCASNQAAGGWGPAQTNSIQPIGNKEVIVAHNIFYNPPGVSSGSQHFAIYGPRTPTASGIPSPQRSDTNLSIFGNIIWNGGSTMPLGIESSDQGCQPSNATCNQTLVTNNNRINILQPDFVNPASADFRPVANGSLSALTTEGIPAHPAFDSSLMSIPEGERANTLTREFSGAATGTRPPGAIAGFSSAVDMPRASGTSSIPSGSTGNGVNNSAPSVKITRLTAKSSKGKITISVTVTAQDDGQISTVLASVNKPKTSASLSKKSNTSYTGRLSFKSKVSKIKFTVTAMDNTGLTKSASKTINLKK